MSDAITTIHNRIATRDPELRDMVPGYDRLTQTQKDSIETRIRNGLIVSIPMKCKGKNCAYSQTCILMEALQESDIEKMVGSRCPIETSIVKHWYLSLSKSLQVDEDDATEVMLLTELVRAAINTDRSANLEAVRGPINQRISIKADTRIIEDIIDPIIEYSEKMLNRKVKILNLFLATRKAKSDANRDIPNDPSKKATRAAMKWKSVVIDAEATVEEA